MTEPTTRLARRLTTGDAVVIGLGSMIGAGVFSAIGPAAEAAGSGLLIGLAIAGVVAYCNATSSAQLAALYPRSGGTYVYGRERLGHTWGFLAGWGFVVGKTASCAAMALTFAAYVAPHAQRWVAAGLVVALTAVNAAGIRKTALATRVIVALVLLALAGVVLACLADGDPSVDRLGGLDGLVDGGVDGLLRSAGLLFFAFAGYARIATLGEEVKDPARAIPRAIPLALGVTLVVYVVVATAALVAVGPDVLATAGAPLEAAVDAGTWDWTGPMVRAAGGVAAAGVLLALLAGVSRTTFAMAAERDLPSWLGAVDPLRRAPLRAELAVGALVTAVVLVADLREVLSVSSFAVLVYYAVANASAWTLAPDDRRWPRLFAAAGLVGCLVLAFTLPFVPVVAGAVMLAAGVVARALLVRRAGALR